MSKFRKERKKWIICLIFTVIQLISVGFFGMLYLYPPNIPTYIDTANSATKTFVSGDYAYVADRESGVAIIDVSDPLNPGTPSYIGFTDRTTDVFVAGKYAYVTTGRDGLAILNVLDPLNPVFVNYIDIAGYAQSVFVSGDYAYVVCGSYNSEFTGLAIVDVSDPLNPLVPIYIDTIGDAVDVFISNDYAYVADGRKGLAIINISDPLYPGSPLYTNSTGNAKCVFVSGDYAYVVGYERFEKLYPEYLLVTYYHFLEIIDISDLLNQETHSSIINITNYTESVFISGDYAYLSTNGDGLAIIDVSEPLNPGTPSYLTTAGYGHDVFVSGDYVYVAERSKGLGIIYIPDIFKNIALFNLFQIIFLGGTVYSVILSLIFAFITVKKKPEALLIFIILFGIFGINYFIKYFEYATCPKCSPW